MRRILVTAVSGNIGYGVLKILKSPEHILYGCDCYEINNGVDLCNYFQQTPLACDEQYIDFLGDFCKKNHIEYIIPCNEQEIRIIATNRHIFEENHIKLILQRDDVLDICLDKKKTMDFLREKNFKVPQLYDNVQYICKPIHSNGSKGIQFVDVRKKLGKSESDYIIQEYIDGDGEYTVGVFSDGRTINNIQFRRELKNGYSYKVKLVSESKLSDIANHLAEVLDLRGYINYQCIRKDDEYYIFEINPRISGTVRFRDMLGFRDVWWWLDMEDGVAVTEFKCNYKKAIGIRELNEKYLIKE